MSETLYQFNRTGIHSLTPYDEKVLSEMTLYGLPMLHLEFPSSFQMAGPEWMLNEEKPGLSEETRFLQVHISDTTGLTALRLTFDLPRASR